MTKSILYLYLILLLSSLTACVQNSNEAFKCYSNEPPDNGEVFTGIGNKPHFKGGHDSLVNFFSTNIDHEEFAGNLSPNRSAFTDTARVKFIVNKQGGISALSITKAKNKKFISELTRAVKRSSCSWVAGGAEQTVNSWHQFDIYCFVEMPSEKELTKKITIVEH